MARTPLIVRIAKRGSLSLALKTPSAPNFQMASCKGKDPEMFFSDSPSDVELAKELCAQCSISKECLAWATRFAAFGVFGGATAQERLTIDKDLPYYDAHVIQDELVEITKKSITFVADKYGVTTRTVSRWRETLNVNDDLDGI